MFPHIVHSEVHSGSSEIYTEIAKLCNRNLYRNSKTVKNHQQGDSPIPT